MQINSAQIPDEAVEAAKLAAAEYLATGVNHTEEKLFSAAITAALNAWAGAYTANQVQAERPPVLCLPFPQEADE
jgi:hypothetical protein